MGAVQAHRNIFFPLPKPKRRRLYSNADDSRDVVLAAGLMDCENKGDPSVQNPTLCDPISCAHPVVQKQMCMICGKDGMEEDYGVQFGYILKDLRLSKSEIGRLSDVNTGNALRNRKLFLVLDLDHTLLHANMLMNLKPEDKYLLKQTDPLENVRDGTLFQFPCVSVLVKLRPFVHEFLEQLSPMFEMYLYTAAAPDYTEKMMELLDPEKKYFDSRVITRADFIREGRKKDLELVLSQDRATVILDDTQLAWPWHQDNLVPIQSYDYFSPRKERMNEIYFPPYFFPSVFHHYRENHYTERKMDEKGSNKVILQSILEVLQEIHTQFFDPKLAAQDVRQIIKTVHGQVLKGCKIFLGLGNLKVFNGILKSMAEELGAVFCAELDSSVTDVVTLPEKRHELEKNRSGFMVLPGWIVGSYKSWQRLPEVEYAFRES